MTVDKETLFKPRLSEEDVTVEGIGTMRVRALSRSEVLKVQQAGGAASALERKILAMALVDPKLTEKEVGMWQDACTADELETVTNTVARISGMDPGAAKRAYKEMESNSDAEFRDVPRTEAGDDGRSPA